MSAADRRSPGRRAHLLAAAALLAWAPAVPGQAQDVVFVDVNPDFSDTDPADPDGATGGRVNGLAVEAGNGQVLYAASEWGGLFKSTDAGLTWARLDAHLPVVTWDVEIDPGNVSRIYATSFFDGKTASRSGINRSTDGGATWTHPATADPPAGFCANAADAVELTAFGIAVDPAVPANVFIGTSCGLAVSTDSGATWAYRDPTAPAGSATRVWDVLAHGGGLLDVCGDDGHLRSTNGGTTWTAGSGLPSGRCSLAVSPDEAYVLLAVVGTTIYETTNAGSPAGATWVQTRSNPSPQGRIPFVATNQRSDAGPDDVFDLWFGDVSLWRVSCTTPAPPAPGGPPRCGSGNSPLWVGPFTRTAGGHDDMGSILFDPEALVDACPILMSSDGGVYYNTDTGADCHNPDWEQPNVTPHGLWLWTMSGADQSGTVSEDLYFGNQDNGVFGTADAGAGPPTWHNEICCDGFSTGADPAGVVWDVCCFGGGGRATRAFRSPPGFIADGAEIDYPPGGLIPSFRYPDSIVNVAGTSYVAITRDCTPGVGGCPAADGGVFYTADIDAGPATWTELGNLSEPPTNAICGIRVALAGGGVPTFFVQTGNCNTTQTTDRLFKYTGTAPFGQWTELFLPSGGFGVFAVHPADPLRLLASGQTTNGGNIFRSTDGGATWTSVPQLVTLMSAGGAIPFKNDRGPTDFTGFNGYWQPSLLAFGPGDTGLAVAGGKDSGIFLSRDGGANWTLVSDPFTSDVSGTPHLPRPWYAYFDVESGGAKSLYVGTQGRGVWRLELLEIFTDGFESGDTSAWSGAVP